MSKIKLLLISVLLFLLSFSYRFNGLANNNPFWVDEFSTASQSLLVVENGFRVFTNPNIFFEYHNTLFHFLIGGLYMLFGPSEFITRLPSVIAGSFVPPLLFLVTYRIFNLNSGLIAGLLAATSYYQIVWSRQARSYMLVQLLVLLGIYFYIQLSKHDKRTLANSSIFGVIITIGLLLHSFYYVFLVVMVMHFVLTNFTTAIAWLKKPSFYIILAMVMAFSYTNHLLPYAVGIFVNQGFRINNLWYYHSFLWREYGLLIYVAFLGISLAFFTHRKITTFILFYIAAHLTLVNFIFAPYTSRYLLPIWPLFIMGFAYALSVFSEVLKKHAKISGRYVSLWFSLFLVGLIIINGYKFDLKPNTFYSVNHDFREIALVNYDKVYDTIKEKGELEKGKTAVIDTWADREQWYLGRSFPHSYLFRWINRPGLTNGIPMKTEYFLNKNGDKIIPISNQRFIGELADLLKAQKRYPRGFIFIDDSTLPKDVIDYAEKNFKKELYLDHYPLDDNPYSIWPATLYSWGIK